MSGLASPALIPAVLAPNRRLFRRRVARARRLARLVHLDVMDGRFVSTRSVGQTALRRLPPGAYELHCMVEDPRPWVAAAGSAGIERVILHVESNHLMAALAQARALGVEAALALKPAASPRRVAPYARLVRRVVCLGVAPGGYGRPFQARVLTTIRAVRRRWPRLTVAADGGVSLATLPRLRAAGARVFVVGSALQRARRPRAAWRALARASRG